MTLNKEIIIIIIIYFRLYLHRQVLEKNKYKDGDQKDFLAINKITYKIVY